MFEVSFDFLVGSMLCTLFCSLVPSTDAATSAPNPPGTLAPTPTWFYDDGVADILPEDDDSPVAQGFGTGTRSKF